LVSSNAVVAVFNTSDEVIDMLALALEDEGFSVVGERPRTVNFTREEQDLQVFLAAHQPQVVIWDIAPPDAENWRSFRAVQHSGAVAGRGVVLTTTKRVLERLVGATGALEIVGKPYDLGAIASAVRRELARRGGGS
jgi:DNA-binding NtrC family response regulator